MNDIQQQAQLEDLKHRIDDAPMNKPIKPEGMDLSFVLWVVWNVVFFTLMWRGRHTLPLWWPGVHDPLGLVILVGGMFVIGILYVWWANRRNSK